jgi:nitrite reductase/ring-hydroxylating ferredoxin subunit
MKFCKSSGRDSAGQAPNGTSRCDRCIPESTRREFLRDAVAAVAVVAGGLGLVPSRALAMRLASASRVSGSEATYPLPPADGVTIDKEREVILVRWEGMIYAFRLACPHQRTMLKWKGKDARFQCPKHKSKYQPDGTFISGKATRGMDRYGVRRTGNEIVVDLDKVYLEDKNSAGWTAAVVKL